MTKTPPRMAALVLFAASACAERNLPPTQGAIGELSPPIAAPEPPPAPTAESWRVFELTNEYRISNGRLALRWNVQLAKAAQDYAERMAEEGFFGHTSPDGVTAGQRIAAAGYAWSSYAENIAYGYKTPEAVMQGWVGSSGHRANLLGTSSRDLGVGYAKSAGGRAYWVQDFGSQ